MIKLVSKSTFSLVLLYGIQFKGVKQISFLTPVVTVWRHFFLTCTYRERNTSCSTDTTAFDLILFTIKTVSGSVVAAAKKEGMAAEGRHFEPNAASL